MFKNKIVVLIIMILVISLAILGAYFLWQFNKKTEEKTVNESKQTLQEETNNLKENLNNLQEVENLSPPPEETFQGNMEDFVIETFSTGQRVLLVSEEYSNLSPFKQAVEDGLQQDLNMTSINSAATFLWNTDGSLKFVGLDMEYLSDFQVEANTFWFKISKDNDGSPIYEITKPNLIDPRKIDIKQEGFFKSARKDQDQNGIVYLTLIDGNGDGPDSPGQEYTVDLKEFSKNKM